MPKHLKLSHEADIVRYEEKLNTSDPRCEACESGDYAVVFCCECREFLCDFCTQPHQKQRKTKKHSLVDLSSNITQEKLLHIPKPDNCRSHGQPLDLACITCHQLPLCAKCALGREHRAHDIKSLCEAANSQANTFHKLAIAASVAVSCLEKAIESREMIKAGIQLSHSSIEKAIHAAFEELEVVLKRQKQDLLQQCQQLALTKTTRILDEADVLDKLKTQIQHSLQTLFNLQESCTDLEFLSVASPLQAQIEHLQGHYSGITLNTNETPSLAFSLCTENLIKAISSYGEMTEGASAKATQVVDVPGKIYSNSTLSLTILARGVDSKPLSVGGEACAFKATLKSKFFSKDGGSIVQQQEAEVCDGKDGTYQVSCIPEHAGEYQMEISFHNTPLVGTPLTLSVLDLRKRYTSITAPSRIIKIKTTPSYLTTSKRNVVVSSFGDSSIRLYNTNGDLLDVLKCKFVNKPMGVAVKGDTVFVACEKDQYVKTLDLDGKFLKACNTSGYLELPLGLSISPTGKLFVIDAKSKQLEIFSSDGTHQSTITSDLVGGIPRGCAFDLNGNCHVTVHCSHISVISPEGKLLRQYSQGLGINPFDITIDENNFSFVTEYQDQGTVSIFDPEGTLVHQIKNLKKPLGITCNRAGSVFVSDIPSYSVAVYDF